MRRMGLSPRAHWLAACLVLGAGCKTRADAAGDGGPAAERAKQPVEGEPAAAEPEIQTADEASVELDTGGLERIRERGTLRVLVKQQDEEFLPRTGMPALRDVEMTEEFAESLGVEPVYVIVEEYARLIPALLEGRGDLIAAQLSVTPERQKEIAFSRSTFGVAEILVGRAGADGLPKSVEDLDGRTVSVRKSSSYAETLARLKKKHGLENLKIEHVPETEDAEDTVFSVTTGERDLTVVDSHILTAIETYNPRFVRLFPLDDKREIAWAVRPGNPDLRTAVDNFVLQKALTSHRQELFAGDLAGIEKRGVLRVLTRNNPITYFLYRGRQFGFEYELAEMMAEALDVRLEMVVPPTRDQLIPWLLEGRGDVIAAGMTVTELRKQDVVFSRPYMFVEEEVVKQEGAKGPTALAELAGRTVTVRPSSSYAETLEALRASGVGVEIAAADEAKETEELIKLVGAGEIALTVSDDNILDVEQAYGVDVEPAFALTGAAPKGAAEDAKKRGSKEIAFAVRPSSPKLRAFLDDFVKKHYRGTRYNVAKRRYFKRKRTIGRFQGGRLAKTGEISPYDRLIKQYAKRYGFDWRLMAAQSYVESRFDPNAKSWVGALGLFQVMPNTGKSLGFTKLTEPAVGIHAGIKYMRRLVSRFDPKIDLKDRVRLALAAYNAGIGHVYDAQRLAKQKGWDPHRWFGNVEKAMLLLQEKEYARQARYGYCRGSEPVKYVSHIQSLYDAYVEIADP